MFVTGRSARLPLSSVLFATAIGAIALACDANLETVCYDGQPCVATGGGGTGGGNGGNGANGGSGGATTTTSSATFDPEGDIPCDVFAILEEKCHICHNANHDNGAPIDLLTCHRFQEDACPPTMGPRHVLATTYVDSNFMPLGATDLTEEEKTIVLGWLQAGAPCEAKGAGCTGTEGTKACFE